MSAGCRDSAAGVLPVTTDSAATFEPDLTLDSTAISLFYNQFITTPNYGTVEVDQQVAGGSIEVFVQGSRDDVSNPGNPVDPDSDSELEERKFTTDWVTIDEIDQIDNYQYLRFRVEFSVDPVHDFGDPLPRILEIRIPVSTVPD